MIKTILSVVSVFVLNVFITLLLITTSEVLQPLVTSSHALKIARATSSSAKELYEEITHMCQNHICFTPDETNHLLDVATIMEYSKATGLFSLLVLLLVFKNNPHSFSALLFKSSTMVLGTISIILITSLVSFQTVFTLFHQVFFPQGNWSFSATSLIIQMYPPEFWQHIGILFLFILMVCTTSEVVFAKLLRQK